MWLRSAALACLVLAGCDGLPVGLGSSEQAQKVCAKGATTTGIDVSHWNGTIDWQAVKQDGVTFAFMKATEGSDFVDSKFATNWQGAKAAGIVRGAYHFYRPKIDPIVQADHLVDTAGAPALGDLPLTLDLEVLDGQPAADVAAGALAFLQRLEQRTSRVPIIYTSARVFDTELHTPDGFSHYALWDANWGVTCPNISTPTWSTWTFWQYTDKGKLGGIDPVDVNVFNGSVDELLAYASEVSLPDGGAGDGALPDAKAPPDGGAMDSAAADGAVEPRHSVVIHGGCTATGVDSSAAATAWWWVLAVVGWSMRRARAEARRG